MPGSEILPAASVGLTIHDEIVEVRTTARGAAVYIDGQQSGYVVTHDAAAARALELVPAHRRRCSTCGRRADRGYLNAAAGERCADAVHVPFVDAAELARLSRHGYAGTEDGGTVWVMGRDATGATCLYTGLTVQS